MDVSLLELIRDSPAEEGTYTHVSFYGPATRWHIKNQDLSGFWERYCQLIYRRPNGLYGLGEKIQDTIPVIVRGTLHFPESETRRPYDDDFIRALVYCYQQALLEYLQISDSCAELTCCVLEAEKGFIDPTFKLPEGTGTVISYMWTLQFPFCRTDVPFQGRVLRPRVIQLLRQHKVMDRMKCHPINQQWEIILDSMVTQSPWPLYGSTRTPMDPKLELVRIYPVLGAREIDIDPGNLDLPKVFLLENHIHVQQGLVKSSIFIDEESGEVDHYLWLPMFLSLHYWGAVVVPKPSVGMEKLSSTRSSSQSSNWADSSSMEISTQLVGMLSRDRLETDHFWIDIGRAFYNIDQGGNQGLEAWINYTEKSDSHDAIECRTLYPTFSVNNYLTLKTIAWYARQDNRELYDAWHRRWCSPLLETALSLNHTDVAIALYRVYWLDFVYSSSDKKWYHFDNHRWNRLDDGLDLRKKISDNFMGLFEQMRTEISREVQTITDMNLKTVKEAQIDKLGAIIRKLKSVTFKNLLMREATEHFHDSDFSKKLNSNMETIGILNGVVETCSTYAVYREGKPEDFISKFSAVRYESDLHWRHTLVERTMQWLRQVFPDGDLLHYFLKLSASCLRGRNRDKIFPVCTGGGDNSKSMIKRLFECTFGNYSFTFPDNIITARKNGVGGPTPELALAIDTRIDFIQEPDSEDTIRNGILKMLTGGDTFFARLCGQDGGNVEPGFKIFYLCNKVPIIPNSDKAVKNRLRIIPFLSTWVDNPPETEEEQFRQRLFKKDNNFGDTIPMFAPAFLWILVEKYRSYQTEGLRQPDIITKYTEEYWEENDPVLEFLKERIETIRIELNGKLVPDTNVKVSMTDLYNEYTFWLRETHPGVKVPDRSNIKYEFTQRWGKPGREGWCGIRFKPSGVVGEVGGSNNKPDYSFLRSATTIGGARPSKTT